MKFREQVLLMMFAIVFFTIQTLVLSQSDSDASCVLDTHSTLSRTDSDCVAGNWGGFVEVSSCGEVFDDYLYALAKRANQTERVFLNSTEQNLLLMKDSEKDVFGCGIEKLTNGAGGCSDYSVNDVLNNLGNTLTKFDEDCNLFDNGRNSMKDEAEVCSFAVLVAITSRRTGYKNRIQALYQCLGDQDFLMASDDSQPDETSCLKIPRKEVYSATANLNASNFIGQGVAGKAYKGVLSNGQHVSVKYINKDGYIDTFIREVRSLSNVRHQNLVALIGYCVDKEECFLVYELCHNGNLSKWLFEGCIVHRDIKARLLADSRNIEEFTEPKLSSIYSMEAFDFLFKLALSCTGLKQQRPSMEQVVKKLEKGTQHLNTIQLTWNHLTLNSS
ncbi:hypothetical protein FEM48_ZijujUnG0092800 [Ziziphus jujuba var. spinosa]|uniref:non-specific serine/threonine protein kinase n=1 Tax=Ziziphus jujuba var. spinosa TaxID=714518 RepID=A0A978U8B7_ZIZJJ|nr:hypothetical protein FEM48_ZijujUnG0092800 [Ziziphus jujuba var. spinosa]